MTPDSGSEKKHPPRISSEENKRVAREKRAKERARELDFANVSELQVRAQKGDLDAMNDLGVIYFEGKQVPKNPQLATKYWAFAAQRGHKGAAHNMRLLNLRDVEEQAAAEGGSFSADFQSRLVREGAKSGDVQVTLLWNSLDDLDLHCQEPAGYKIWYQNRISPTGGMLDVDMNVSPESHKPVENIFWPKTRAPSGMFTVRVVCYTYRQTNNRPIPFRVAVKANGKVHEYNGQLLQGQTANICQFRVP